MKFKTVIRLVSDVRDRSEALELVEEYLAGNITSGVDMKCVTKPMYNAAKIAGVATLSLVMAGFIFLGSYMAHSRNLPQTVLGVDAVQTPLKTSAIRDDSEFKREWQNRQIKESLDQIKR